MDRLAREILDVLERPRRAEELVEILLARGFDPRDVRRVLAELVKTGIVEKMPDYGARVFLFRRK